MRFSRENFRPGLKEIEILEGVILSAEEWEELSKKNSPPVASVRNFVALLS